MSEEKEIMELEQEENSAVVSPEGDPLMEFDITITTAALYDYFLRHVYSSFTGLLNSIIGVILIILYFAKKPSVIYLIFGIVLVIYVPWTMFLTAKKQAGMEQFKKPIHYAFYENGMEVSQGDVHQMQLWEQMVKAVSTTKSIILYTGKNAASIFPRKDILEKEAGLIQIISTHMEPKKVKIKS